MITDTSDQLKLYTREEAERLYNEFYRNHKGLMMSVEFFWYFLETDNIRTSGVEPMPFEEWRLLPRIVESTQ